VLILAPLGVVPQTIKEGEKFGYVVKELGVAVFDQDLEKGIYITNYDNLENIDTFLFSGVVLDESSILKNFDGKTKQKIIDGFKSTPYKLACTATPSPNDTMELCNHAEFLDVMNRNEMLAMYFVHDGGSTSSWRLKGHAKQMFWDFVSTWAVMLSSPEDIGYDGSKYILPNLNFIEEVVETKKRDNGMLFNDMAVSATSFHKELRNTMDERLNRVAEIVNGSNKSFIIWVGHDEEGSILKSLIPDSVEVKGSDTKGYKKDKLLGFGCGSFRVLITKLKIAQFGLNYQNCHNQIFASLDFSFESTYQGIRRSYRFGQNEDVNVWLITTDTMQNVKKSYEDKQKQFDDMKRSMSEATRRNVKNELKLMKTESVGKYVSENCTIKLGDCVQLIREVKDESVGFSIFSPPFAELYTYSDKLEVYMSTEKGADTLSINCGIEDKKHWKEILSGDFISSVWNDYKYFVFCDNVYYEFDIKNYNIPKDFDEDAKYELKEYSKDEFAKAYPDYETFNWNQPFLEDINKVPEPMN
jgi:hypothetical protein